MGSLNLAVLRNTPASPLRPVRCIELQVRNLVPMTRSPWRKVSRLDKLQSTPELRRATCSASPIRIARCTFDNSARRLQHSIPSNYKVHVPVFKIGWVFHVLIRCRFEVWRRRKRMQVHQPKPLPLPRGSPRPMPLPARPRVESLRLTPRPACPPTPT